MIYARQVTATSLTPGDIVCYGGGLRRITAIDGIRMGYVRARMARVESPQFELGTMEFRCGSCATVITEVTDGEVG